MRYACIHQPDAVPGRRTGARAYGPTAASVLSTVSPGGGSVPVACRRHRASEKQGPVDRQIFRGRVRQPRLNVGSRVLGELHRLGIPASTSQFGIVENGEPKRFRLRALIMAALATFKKHASAEV